MDEIKDNEVLDYDKMKIEEGGAEVNGAQANSVLGEAFKVKKLKDPNAPLRKYMESFVKHEDKNKASEINVEEDEENMQTPGNFFAKKIDKSAYYKDLQKCMNRWNKNKNSSELNDMFSKLTKDASESEGNVKHQRDSGTFSIPSVKEDKKKKNKGNNGVHHTGHHLKENKDMNVMRKAPDSAMSIENAIVPMKDSKKGKEKENADELLIMFYEFPIKEQEFDAMFKASVIYYLKEELVYLPNYCRFL
jgi:hypothetical protein